MITVIVDNDNINLDFIENTITEVDDVPDHLIPNEQMRQNFIQNCKDLGCW